MTTKIYTNTGPEPFVDVPKLDLLTLLFGKHLVSCRQSANGETDSKHGVSHDNTVLHLDASNPSNKITKNVLRSLVRRIAHGLRTCYGVGANGPNKDVVTVISYGQLLIPAVFFGVIAVGGVYSAASPTSTVSELARQIEIGASRLVICGQGFERIAKEATTKCNLGPGRIVTLKSTPSWSLKSLSGKIIVLQTDKF
jgi:4-coumarate--CoA ligase